MGPDAANADRRLGVRYLSRALQPQVTQTSHLRSRGDVRSMNRHPSQRTESPTTVRLRVAPWLPVLAIAVLGQPAALAEIYQYQDARGRTIFSDRPPPDAAPTSTALPAAPLVPAPSAGSDLAARLERAYPNPDPLQRATLAATAVHSSTGQGAGFFVTDDGYLLTNRHVVRPTETGAWQAQEQELEAAEDQLRDLKRELRSRRKLTADAKAALDEYDGPPDSGRGRMLRQRHAYYQDHHKTLDAQIRDQQDQLRAARREIDWKGNSARVARVFSVVLKDGTEHQAYLIAVSDDHDLALLKLDGVRTPSLRVGPRPQQGQAVHAIGTPLGQRDSITPGVITKIGRNRILTNVQLLPGNSGGPLIDGEGGVIGVNFAKLTQGSNANYQGFGMTIPIDRAEQAFPEIRGRLRAAP